MLEVRGEALRSRTPKDVAIRTYETTGLVSLGRLGGACLDLRSTFRAERPRVDDAPLLVAPVLSIPTQVQPARRRQD